MARPGLLTVHCWSRVRSLVDCCSKKKVTIKDQYRKSCPTEAKRDLCICESFSRIRREILFNQ